MNDDQLLREVGMWLKDADPEPPDANEHVRQAMARTPRVHQRGRWWPLPILRRPKGQPTVRQTVSDRLTLVPATNGHAPNVIGRTKSMISPVNTITAGALIFAIGAVMLVAQPFGQETSVPGAEQHLAAQHPPEPFSAVVDCGGQIAVGSTESLEIPLVGATMTIVARRGDTWRPTVREVSDPRFEGRYSISSDADSYYAPGLTAQDVVGAGTWRIENDEGAWQGSFGYMDPLDGGEVTVMVPLKGEGAYEGLTAMVESAHDSVACVWQWRGLVVDGDLPAYPEPPAE